MNHELDGYWQTWWRYSKVIIATTLVMVIPSLFYNRAVAIGALAGGTVAFLNFRLIAVNIQKAVNMSPEQARMFTFSRYLIRFVLTMLLFSVLLLRKDLGVSALMGAIPPFFSVKLALFLNTLVLQLMSYTKNRNS